MDDEASLIPGIRDFYLLLVLPIAAYWLSASIFHLFDCQRWFQDYKIHTYEDGEKRNRATLGQVFRQVVAQQLVQVAFSLAIDRALTASSPEVEATSIHKVSDLSGNSTIWSQQTHASSDGNSDSNLLSATSTAFPSASAKLALQLTIAVIVADFWQYAWHRIFHTNKFLYSELEPASSQPMRYSPLTHLATEHIHSVHHRIYVPYSYGALYSSLFEAFIVDTIGTTVTLYLSGLPVLPATWFASLSIIKSVNDHSGYRFPYNPFNYISTNTTDFHDIHHQNWGMKYNYSQVYLTIWVSCYSIHYVFQCETNAIETQDDLLGTTMPAKQVEARRARIKESASAAADPIAESKKTE